MRMEQIVDSVVDKVLGSGLVQIEISARHVHLTEEALQVLFGEGHALTHKRDLSQPGQFLCEERVCLIGPKGRKENVAVLGPVRKANQVEVSRSDAFELGIQAPLRLSGEVDGSGDVTIQGPAGILHLQEGAIVAKNHIHVTPDVAAKLHLEHGQEVDVEVLSDRPVILKNVAVRVDERSRYRLHVDFDEGNGAAVGKNTYGKIVQNTQKRQK